MNTARLTILILVFGVLSASGQISVTLDEAIRMGLENHLNIRIAQRSIDIAANNVQVIPGKYPLIDMGLSANNSYVKNQNPASFASEISSLGTSLTPGLSANWAVYNGNRVQLTGEQLNQVLNAAENDKTINIEEIIGNIIQAYYDALLQKEQVNLTNTVLDLSKDRLSYQELRQEFGQAQSFDILQTKDALFTDSTNVLIATTTYGNQLLTLAQSMGLDSLRVVLSEEDRLDIDQFPYGLDQLNQLLLDNNSQLKAQEINRRLAIVNTRLLKAEQRPSINLAGGVNYNWNNNWTGNGVFAGTERDLGGITSTTWTGFVNVNATYPIFDGGVRRNRIDNAQIEEEISALNYQETFRQLTFQLQTLWDVYQNQLDVADLALELENNAIDNLAIADERLKTGLINSFDYRTVQVSYASAVQSRLQAIYNTKITEMNMMRLVGLLRQ